MVNPLKISFKVVFLAIFFLNLLVYHNAFHPGLRYDCPEIYKPAELPTFKDRVKFAFLANGKGDPVSTKFSWFRPVPFLISWEFFRAVDRQPEKVNLFNVLILSVFGFILFRFLLFLFNLPVLALVSALLFCLHPVNGIWVNYPPGGVHGFFVFGLMIAAMYAFFLYARDDRSIGMYFFSLFLFSLALLSHEIAIFLPLSMALTIHCLLMKDRRRAYFSLVGFVVLAAAYLWVRSSVLPKRDSAMQKMAEAGVDWLTYGGSLVKVFIIYLGKLVSLQGIVINWCEPFLKTNVWPWLFLGGVLLCVFISLIVSRRQGIVTWALGLLFVGFIPVCAGGMLVPKEGLIYESHWLLFTSIGFFVLFGLMIDRLYSHWRRLAVGVMICLVIFWVNVAWQYNRLYSDELRYALYYRDNAPGFRVAHIFVFQAYYNIGKLREAREALTGAFRGDKKDRAVYVYAAFVDTAMGEYARAEDSLLKSISLDPHNPPAKTLLGFIYENRGDYAKAQKLYDDVAKIDPLCEEGGRFAYSFADLGQEENAVLMDESCRKIRESHKAL